MQKQIKAYIYCRVGEGGSRNLLDFQADALEEYALKNNMNVIGVIKEMSEGKWLDSFEMNFLTNAIRKREINVVLVYCRSRISIYRDIVDEFEMFCHAYHVQLLSIKDYMISQLI